MLAPIFISASITTVLTTYFRAKTVAQSANTNLQPQPLVGRPSSTLEGTCVPGTNVRVDLSDDPFFSVETVEPVTYFTLDKDMKKK
jgi:hypothetical protein